MAGTTIKGITIEIGGNTTKLGKALQDSEKQSISLKKELKDVNKLLKFDPKNTDLLNQKHQILARSIEETKSKLNTLRQAQSQVEKQFKSGDIGEEQYREFQREIAKTEQDLRGFAVEAGKVENDLKGLGVSCDKIGDDIEGVGDSAKQNGDGFTIMKGALADMVANVITSAISAIGNLLSSLMDLSEATEEYRTMQAKLAGSADTFGYSVDFANSKYQEFYKYLGDDQMATNAITNLMGLGTSTESISAIAEGATAVWATYGDSIPIESLTESINETINAGKVTGSFADTINWCKDSQEQLGNALSGNKKAQDAYNKAIKDGETVEDAFNIALSKVTDEQERADIVAQFLNSTYGESKEKFDELNSSVLDMNAAELELKETQAQLGEAVSPVNAAITNLKSQALQAITPLVEKLVDSFMKLYEWFQKHPTALKVLTGVVIGLAAAFTVLAGALAIQGIITGVTKAIAFLNTTLWANPITWIVAAIAALVAAFIYLWKNCDEFRNFWINLWKKIKEVASVAWEYIKKAFSVAWEFIKSVWDDVKPYFEAVWEGIKVVFSVVAKILSGYFSVAWKAIKVIWNVAVNYFKSVWKGIKLVFSVVKAVLTGDFSAAWEGIKKIWNLVVNYFKTIWNGVKAIFSVVDKTLGGFFSKAWNSIKKIWNSCKQFFIDRFNDVKRPFVNIASWFSEKFREAFKKVKDSFNGWKSFFSDLLGKIKGYFSLDNFKEIFNDSIVGGLKAIVEDVGKAAKEVWEAVKKWFKEKIAITFGFGGGSGDGGGSGGGSGGSLKPFNVGRISSHYGWRKHPITGKRKFHTGTDFAATGGTPIQSTTYGIVTRVQSIKTGYGKNVTVTDPTGYQHLYGHMRSIGVKKGVFVSRGSVLGQVGTTGASTGNHLHYEVRKPGGGHTNPKPWWSRARAAMGGLIKRGQMAWLEGQGTEAIVPLEKNTGWLNHVAQMLLENIGRVANTSDTINSQATLLTKLDKIYDKLDRMQIVLDSGTLVGETIDKIDKALADKQMLNERGV